ncbi:MAG: Gfo/Idh/MocA family protein [Steroidobacteraceae bacterium]
MKVGIISANWSLKVHGAAWRLFPDVEVAAICTAHRETAEAAAAAFNVPRAYWNVDDLVADPDLDIIDVGTRPSYRYPMVMAALGAGKHVYEALPFAVDVAKAESMRDLQLKSGRVGVIDAQFRWVPAAQHLKRLLDDGCIGRPLGFNLQLFLPLHRHEDFVYSYCAYPGNGLQPYKWLAEKSSGAGAWRNFGTHSMLLLTHLIGDISEVSGCLSKGIDRWDLPDGSKLPAENEDLGSAVLRMKNGATGTVQTGWCVPDTAGLRLELWGDRGRVLLEDPSFGDGTSARLFIGNAQPVPYGTQNGSWVTVPSALFEVPGTGLNQSNAYPYMVSMAWMFHDMLRAIREGGSGSPNFTEAARVHRAVEAVVVSDRERRWVRLDDFK